MSAARARAAGGAPGRPWSERLCDGAVIGFALWTLCCHALVAAGGSLSQLVLVYAGALAATAAGFALARRRGTGGAEPRDGDPGGREAAVAGPEQATAASDAPLRRWRPVLQAAGFACGVAALLTLARPASPFALWWSVVGLLAAAAAVFLLAEPARVTPPCVGRRAEGALWAVALACVAVTLVAHRPDLDDCFYVNVAVAHADDPSRPLLSGDTLFGVPSLPLHMPAHRLHTWEVWNGALAWLTGVPAIYCFHLVSASLAALLVPLAHARLFRLLAPRAWPAVVLLLVCVLLATGETHRWYGNFAFVRMWQGKAPFLFVFLPLVYAHAMRFALRPSPGRFALLAGAQIAALGCSSSALWAAPVAALTGMACVLRPTPRELARLGVGALASLYVLGAGLGLKADLQGLVAPVLESAFDSARPGEPLVEALGRVLGSGRLAVFGIAAVVLSWSVQPRGLGQRFAIAVPLAVWLVLLDPYIATWIGTNVTGASYWRAMWALPLPTLMTLLLAAPLHLPRRGIGRVAGPLACAAAVGAYAAFVPRFPALDARNGGAGDVGIRIGWPGLKVPADAWRWAAALNAAVPPGSTVVAPSDVSPWIPTFHHHAYPLQPRRMYLAGQQAHLGERDATARHLLTRYVGGEDVLRPAAPGFAWGLEHFGVRGVLLRRDDPVARGVLRNAGFERTLAADGVELWVR